MKRKYTGIILIIVGLVIIGTAIIMKYDGYIKQRKMLDEFEKTINVLNKEDPPNTSGQGEFTSDLESKGAIGIIKIPKIDLKVAIGDGVDMKTLKYAVGHFPDTPYPGEEGNCAIAGHRSYTYNQYFNRLNEVAEGDKIIIHTKNGEFTYSVYEKFEVLPEEVSVLNNTKDSELTLITCTPVRVATHRLIIKARME